MQSTDIIDNKAAIPTFEDGTKLTAEQKLYLWSRVSAAPAVSSRAILEHSFSINITIRHLNRLRSEWDISRPKGRPRKPDVESLSQLLPVPVRQETNLPFIGVHIFSCWAEMQEIFPTALDMMKQAIDIYTENHPEDSFPLLGHRDDTLLCRFKALFFAPLFGVGKLIEYDVREHTLETVIGRSYQSSTLNQYLGQLERIDATPILMNALIPTDDDDDHVCFIDGHMIPFWSRVSMHKGKITMLGRIMAGSQVVAAHIEDGRAIFFDYQPPDTRLPRIIIDFCTEIVTLTGIRIFVIDREVNSVAIAREFAERGWGLLSMLDKNEYTDLSDWNTEYVGKLDDGAEVYAGNWSEKRKKADDPRTFVLAVREGGILPYWGTMAVVESVAYLDWPLLYSQRTEIQENNFKRMKEHGALDVNFGIKKIVSEDRHHQRKIDKMQDKLGKSEERLSKKKKQIEEQESKVQESESKGHGKRLEQRRNRQAVMNADYAKAEAKLENIKNGIERLGPPGERSDRDFRKQSIMTLRTLLLENTLIEFMSLLMACITGGLCMSLDSLIRLLFERSGGLFETPSELVYFVNMKGLSKPNKLTMCKLIEGLNKMGLERDGKPVSIRARGHPSP